MKSLEQVAMLLVVIGAINWGLVGLLDMNVVASLGDGLAKIVYILVGVSGVYVLYGWLNKKK